MKLTPALSLENSQGRINDAKIEIPSGIVFSPRFRHCGQENTMSEIFTAEEERDILSFYNRLLRVHQRLMDMGYTVINGELIEPTIASPEKI
jgi:hypothetical protein